MIDLGFVILVIGMGIYNGVWEHLIRRLISRPPISSERSQLLPGHQDTPTYESTADITTDADADAHVTPIPDTPSA